MNRRRKILFVCIGNSCRSQMAEALARHLAPELIEPSSAGLSPLGSISPPTREVLLERGVGMEGQYSKGLSEVPIGSAELIVNLTGLPGPSVFSRATVEVQDWVVKDPYGEDLEIYRRVRDEIETRVVQLADSLHRATRRRGARKGTSATPADQQTG